MREVLPYNPSLKGLARNLRKRMTYGEVKLWHYLRKKQLGYDFHRQKPVNNFIIDFYCVDLKLAIEIDGKSHDDNRYKFDVDRQRKLESLGISVIRFSESEVLSNVDGVIYTIRQKIKTLEL